MSRAKHDGRCAFDTSRRSLIPFSHLFLVGSHLAGSAFHTSSAGIFHLPVAQHRYSGLPLLPNIHLCSCILIQQPSPILQRLPPQANCRQTAIYMFDFAEGIFWLNRI
jgi:hypothetical protein